MPFNPKHLNPRGFTLIEILIGGMIMIVLLLGITTFTVSQMRESKYLYQKLEAIDLEENLIRTLSSKKSCDCMFNSNQTTKISLNPSQTPSVSIPRLTSGCDTADWLVPDQAFSGSQSGLKISTISFENALSGDGINFRADLTVSFSAGLFAISPKPIVISQGFKTGTNGQIESCLGAAISGQLNSLASLCSNISGGSIDTVTGTCVISPSSPAQSPIDSNLGPQTCPSDPQGFLTRRYLYRFRNRPPWVSCGPFSSCYTRIYQDHCCKLELSTVGFNYICEPLAQWVASPWNTPPAWPWPWSTPTPTPTPTPPPTPPPTPI